jgi:hypothetical protein
MLFGAKWLRGIKKIFFNATLLQVNVSIHCFWQIYK